MAMSRMGEEYNGQNTSPIPMWYLHAFFSFIYIVLLADIVLLTLHLNSDLPSVPIVDKIASLFYEPFRGNSDLDIPEGFWPGPAIIFALLSFGLLHFGISTAKPGEPEASLMNHIVSFFRLIFLRLHDLASNLNRDSHSGHDIP